MSLVVLEPVEYLTNKRFYKKAKQKLIKSNPLVIGITGSAGKTTTKSILYQMLSKVKNTFSTPKSFNTINGISKAINENMNECSEIAIIEYGASKAFDIEKSLKLCKCDISVITNFGFQHLETFGTIENLVREKCKIIENSKLHICPKENLKYYNEYNIKLPQTIIIGEDYVLKDYNIINKNGNLKMKLTVYEKKTNIFYTFYTNLLGRLNCNNIIIAVAIMRYLEYNFKTISYLLERVVPVENRLNIKKEKIGDIEKVIIDDSFNSNKEGFLEALEILKENSSQKAIITPGIVTGGDLLVEINREVAQKICEVCDEIIIVRSIASKYIEDVLNQKLVLYTEVNSFLDGYKQLLENKNVKTILIENDITDYYKE